MGGVATRTHGLGGNLILLGFTSGLQKHAVPRGFIYIHMYLIYIAFCVIDVDSFVLVLRVMSCILVSSHTKRDLRSRRRGEKGATPLTLGSPWICVSTFSMPKRAGGLCVARQLAGGVVLPPPSSRLADRWRRSFWSKSIRWHGFYKGGAGKIFRSTLSHAKKGAVERCVRCSQAGRKDICTTAQQCEETWRVLAA